MDFSSIDRLVEFGLGIGVAQQMVNTMNHAIGNMALPGTAINSNQQPSTAYYAIIDAKQAGPLTPDELNLLVKKGAIVDDTLMWRTGLPAWRMAADIPDVKKLILLL